MITTQIGKNTASPIDKIIKPSTNEHFIEIRRVSNYMLQKELTRWLSSKVCKLCCLRSRNKNCMYIMVLLYRYNISKISRHSISSMKKHKEGHLMILYPYMKCVSACIFLKRKNLKSLYIEEIKKRGAECMRPHGS